MAINQYKYENTRVWASILGRVLAGYLEANEEMLGEPDLLIATPTYLGPGSRRTWDHIQGILDEAEDELMGSWPFDTGPPAAIIKTRDTTSMQGKTWVERRRIASEEIRPSLLVPDPARVAGKDILVFDDVFTDGSTIEEVARALREAGAAHVSQVVLARMPWTH